MTETYHDFLEAKAQLGGDHGFAPVLMPDDIIRPPHILGRQPCFELRPERLVTFDPAPEGWD